MDLPSMARIEQIQVIHELAEMEPESKCESVVTNGRVHAILGSL